MKGTHRIIVENSRIRFEFEVKSNLTIVRGDSATGKTTLVEMIGEYFNNGNASGINYVCDKPCAVLAGRRWENSLLDIQDSIVFIDTGNDFITSERFASLIKDTDNYYVIVSREPLSSLSYSSKDIYGIRNLGKSEASSQTINEFYQLYGREGENITI